MAANNENFIEVRPQWATSGSGCPLEALPE